MAKDVDPTAVAVSQRNYDDVYNQVHNDLLAAIATAVKDGNFLLAKAAVEVRNLLNGN